MIGTLVQKVSDIENKYEELKREKRWTKMLTVCVRTQ